MSLSRKRQKELKRLRSAADELWGNQQAVIDQANVVAKEASRQLGNYTRESVVPKVKYGYETGVASAKLYAGKASKAVGDTVVPAAGHALGAALAIGDVAQQHRLSRAASAMKSYRAPEPEPKKHGFGTFLAIAAGVAAAGAVAYAVWQTFRADDELWVADDEPTPPSPA
ncbi:DNA helicase [Agromyces seonyuensis]|uniref:DNA helicase n=1 Tax=Agromyces seonyuensis TaxID=2662446 RepID=A0A6I4NYC9_9MICO|nr:DNA helicase [Agromyces seonyuensis]MWB97455.1 DNA helicase [Agromyces seonyuensis]